MTKLLILVASAALSHAQTARMQDFAKALGVECAQCHIPDHWTQPDKPTFAFTIRMEKMQESLNTGLLHDRGGVTCWTCHRGNTKPVRMPRAGWEERLAKWPASLKLPEADTKKKAEEVYANIQSLKGAAAGSLPMTMSVFAAALVSCLR